MRALIQRVSEAAVTIDGKRYSQIGPGLVILLGIRKGESPDEASELAERCTNLRIFLDDEGRMNRSVRDTGGEALVVSQFTLYADTTRGNRPGFSDAATSAEAEPLYEKFVGTLSALLGKPRVKTGVFGAMMQILLVNEGPVTISVDSRGFNTTRHGGRS